MLAVEVGCCVGLCWKIGEDLRSWSQMCGSIGEGAFKCSLTLSPSDLPDSPNVAAGTMDMWALVLIDDSCLFSFGILVLVVAQCCPKCISTFEMYLYPSSFA